MGANTSYRSFRTHDKKEIVRLWNDEVDQSLHENGHSYSGCIGMLGPGIKQWFDVRFVGRDKAEERIAEVHNKGESAIAVSYLDSNLAVNWLVGGWCRS